MTAKPINPSFAEFSGDAPILWGSRTQVRQKLLRKWSKQSVSSELTQPEINIPPPFSRRMDRRLIDWGQERKGATGARTGEEILPLLSKVQKQRQSQSTNRKRQISQVIMLCQTVDLNASLRSAYPLKTRCNSSSEVFPSATRRKPSLWNVRQPSVRAKALS